MSNWIIPLTQMKEYASLMQMKTAWVLKGKTTSQLSCWCINEGLPPRDLPNDLIHVLWEDGVFLWHFKNHTEVKFYFE